MCVCPCFSDSVNPFTGAGAVRHQWRHTFDGRPKALYGTSCILEVPGANVKLLSLPWPSGVARGGALGARAPP